MNSQCQVVDMGIWSDVIWPVRSNLSSKNGTVHMLGMRLLFRTDQRSSDNCPINLIDKYKRRGIDLIDIYSALLLW
jgi:hypothetical protein